MRKIAVATVATLAFTGLGIAPATADGTAMTLTNESSSDSTRSSADSERRSRCVTKKEFRKVRKGMKMKRVHRIFDVSGKVTSSAFGSQDREYKPCTSRRWGFVDVSYERKRGAMRVWFKYAYWG